MSYDYFISHASEDKPLIARPLARLLEDAHFQVWYDEFSLRVGDSLLESINRGIQESKYGVVIISPAFISKMWPSREFISLVTSESESSKKLLPVWHNVSLDEVKKFSLLLADRVAVVTSRGLQAVTESLVRASFPERVTDLPLSRHRHADEAPEAMEVLRHVLSQSPTIGDVRLLLSAYHVLLRKLFPYVPTLIPGHRLPGPVDCDFVMVIPHGITGPMEIVFVYLGSITDDDTLPGFLNNIRQSLGEQVDSWDRPANDYLGVPYVGQYPNLTAIAEAMRGLVDSQNFHWSNPDVWNFRLQVLYGRRGVLTVENRDSIVKSSGLKVDVASYDRLLDA